MLKTMVTMAGILEFVQAVQLPAAEAQSGYPSSNDPGSLKDGARYRPILFANHNDGELPAHDGVEGTTLPRSSDPVGCCVSPEGRSAGMPESSGPGGCTIWLGSVAGIFCVQ
jgi:hypothetical protein